MFPTFKSTDLGLRSWYMETFMETLMSYWYIEVITSYMHGRFPSSVKFTPHPECEC